jgi:Ribbon-helix-helix domain
MAKKKTALQNRLRLVKVPTMAYLDPEQATALRELSAKSGKPMQSYLREGVELVIAKYRGERK